MKKRNVLNYLLLCFTFVFAFFVGIHFSLVNAENVNIYNRGGITGYGFEDAHKYKCSNTVYSGVVKIEGPYGEYYCSQCLKSLPDGSWGGVARSFPYTSTGNVYYTCNDPTTSSYAENQHTIWDLFKYGSLSRTNNCSGTAYKLVEFSSDEGSNYQKVVRIEEEEPYDPGPTIIDTEIIFTKQCGQGVSGTFDFVVTDSTGSADFSLDCGKNITIRNIEGSSATIQEINVPSDIEVSNKLGNNSFQKGTSISVSSCKGVNCPTYKYVTFLNEAKRSEIGINKVCKNGLTGTFNFNVHDGDGDHRYSVPCGGYTSVSVRSGNVVVTELDNLSNVVTSVEDNSGNILNGKEISLNVVPNTTKTVKFTNTLKDGHVVLSKSCPNGLTGAYEFNVHDGDGDHSYSVNCGDSKTIDVKPGEVTIKELNVSVNVETEVKEGNGTAKAGDTITLNVSSDTSKDVQFINKLKGGIVVLNKICKNGLTGTFNFNVHDGDGDHSYSVNCGDSKTIDVKPGEVTIKELNVPSNVITEVKEGNGTAKAGDTITLNVQSNDNKTITYTNTLKDGHIVLNKVCKNGLTGTFNFNVHDGDGDHSYSVNCGDSKTIDVKPGEVTIKELNVPSNVITEVKEGNGTAKTNSTITLNVPSDTSKTITYKNTLKDGKLTINKVCKNGLTGKFNFVVHDGNGNHNYSINCGDSKTIDVKPGDVTITEKDVANNIDTKYKVDNGSLKDGKVVSFKFVGGDTKNVTFENTLLESVLILNKTCSDGLTGNYNFSVVDASGSRNYKLACGGTKEIKVFPGNVTISESGVPSNVDTFINYKNAIFDKGFSKTINIDNGVNKTVTFYNKLLVGKITVVKKDFDSKLPLKDVVFKLVKIVDGKEIPAVDSISNKEFGEVKTNENGELIFNNLAFGKYKLIEVDNPVIGYVKSKPVEFDIGVNSLLANSTIYNKLIKLYINKTNLDGSLVLEGVTFKVKKLGGEEKDVTITNDNDYLILTPGEYVITEIVAPHNYETLSDEIKIKVFEDGIIKIDGDFNNISFDQVEDKYVLTVKNDFKKINIFKKDMKNKKMIEGATFEILKEDGTLVKSFESTKNVFRYVLEPGNYVLVEKSAPRNYDKLIDSIKFAIDDDYNLVVSEDDSEVSKFYKIDGNNIIVYNDKMISVPDTGVGLKIGLIVLAAGAVGAGVYFIVKANKKKEN